MSIGPYLHTPSNLPIVQGHLYIIDVSQSVDLDHPLALDFLKEDCLHVSVSGS
jgi:RIO kinase 1